MASIFHHLLSAHLVLLLPLVVAQSSAGDIRVGSSIKATRDAKPWVSPSRDFAFGFHQLETNNDLFLLAIWYYKVPSRTIVWYANGDKPTPTRSKAKLTADRGLVFSDPQGQPIRESEIATADVAFARMNNTSNFMVYGSGSKPQWQSFKNHTDTLLLTQVLERGGVLSSQHKESNFSKGRFQFRLLPQGNDV